MLVREAWKDCFKIACMLSSLMWTMKVLQMSPRKPKAAAVELPQTRSKSRSGTAKLSSGLEQKSTAATPSPKRGRKPTATPAATALPTSSKRGRKQQAPTTPAAASTSPSPKRGRKSKHSATPTATGAVAATTPAAAAAATFPSPKRGRKQTPAAPALSSASTAPVPATSSKRGRKPKAPAATEEGVVAPTPDGSLPSLSKRQRKLTEKAAAEAAASSPTVPPKRQRKQAPAQSEAAATTPAAALPTNTPTRERKPKATAAEAPAPATAVGPSPKRGRKPKAPAPSAAASAASSAADAATAAAAAAAAARAAVAAAAAALAAAPPTTHSTRPGEARRVSPATAASRALTLAMFEESQALNRAAIAAYNAAHPAPPPAPPAPVTLRPSPLIPQPRPPFSPLTLKNGRRQDVPATISTRNVAPPIPRPSTHAAASAPPSTAPHAVILNPRPLSLFPPRSQTSAAVVGATSTSDVRASATAFNPTPTVAPAASAPTIRPYRYIPFSSTTSASSAGAVGSPGTVDASDPARSPTAPPSAPTAAAVVPLSATSDRAPVPAPVVAPPPPPPVAVVPPLAAAAAAAAAAPLLAAAPPAARRPLPNDPRDPEGRVVNFPAGWRQAEPDLLQWEHRPINPPQRGDYRLIPIDEDSLGLKPVQRLAAFKRATTHCHEREKRDGGTEDRNDRLCRGFGCLDHGINPEMVDLVYSARRIPLAREPSPHPSSPPSIPVSPSNNAPPPPPPGPSNNAPNPGVWIMVSDRDDQRAAKEFVRKQGIRNVKFLSAVVISRAEQLVVVDALKEQEQSKSRLRNTGHRLFISRALSPVREEHRKKFGKELRGAKRLIGVHIERCEPIIKKMRNE
ncbi:hypothetical protein PRIPAC_88363 [Pristionchus pacificus]|uniref:Uncharacterized protein n=1 Tax=Pristionchus pacificus TaxID=54126 RepID=A0A2A6B3Y3_PRIPA|nr:hypothetical protein PRIPAC_88363 [Pristionchus pacificus]|eukprot:PDM60587.1 hypothetical protein PRIPAC_53565 [Pristionchus pacificus]